MEKRELTCISCPMGCQLTAEIDNGNVSITGNTCKLGSEYGHNEVLDPKRMVTTSVMAKGAKGIGMLSVKTAHPIPKNKIFDCLSEIKKTNINSDIHTGDVVIGNILNLGVDIVATRDIQF